MPALQDFQFFNTARLTQLYEKDNAHEVHKHAQAQVRPAPAAPAAPRCNAACPSMPGVPPAASTSRDLGNGGVVGSLLHRTRHAKRMPPLAATIPLQREAQMKQQGASEEAIAAELAPKEDDPQPLTDEELAGERGGQCGMLCAPRQQRCLFVPARALQWGTLDGQLASPSSMVATTSYLPPPCWLRPAAEREQLLQQGFSNWMRRDFNAFVRACEKYGRHNLADIARDIESKTEEEVGSGVAGSGTCTTTRETCCQRRDCRA